MNLKEIMQINKDYNTWKSDMDNLIIERKRDLEKTNKQLSIDEFNSLTYEEAKDVFYFLQYNLDFNNQLNQLKNALQSLKIKQYPVLSKAHYYPIINKIDFLTDNEKNKLDFVLKKFYGKYIMTESMAWYSLELDNDTETKILEFLCNNKIIQRIYKLSCTCGSDECDGEFITQYQYDKFIAYHSITQENLDKMTDEEYDNYEKRWITEGYFNTGCWNDGDVEIYTIEGLKEHSTPHSYINNTPPDTTYHNLS